MIDLAAKTALYYAKIVQLGFRLEGWLILIRSKGNYQAVFNEPVTWQKLRVLAWTYLSRRRGPWKRIVLHEFYHHLVESKKLTMPLGLEERRANRYARMVLKRRFA